MDERRVTGNSWQRSQQNRGFMKQGSEMLLVKGLTLRRARVNWIKVFPPLQLQLPAHASNLADALSVLEEGEQTSRQKEKRMKKVMEIFPVIWKLLFTKSTFCVIEHSVCILWVF